MVVVESRAPSSHRGIFKEKRTICIISGKFMKRVCLLIIGVVLSDVEWRGMCSVSFIL